LEPLQRRLDEGYRFVEPRLPPVAGAAMYAAKLNGAALGDAVVRELMTHFPA
jgi:hypothetical protein